MKVTHATRWLWAILILAAVLRFVPVWFGLPYFRARPDEETAVGIAVRLLDGDLNPHFFHWPSLTFYLLAAVFAAARGFYRLAGAGDPGAVHYLVLGRIVVACAGVATVVILYRLGRRMAGEAVGLIAALLLAVAMLHVRDSHFAMTDVLATLLVTSSLAVVLRALDAPSLRWWAVAGALAGLATSTKYNAAAVGASMLAAQLVLAFRSERVLAPKTWMPSVVYGLALVAAFVLATPYAALDFPAFKKDVLFDVEHLAGGHGGVNLGRGWWSHAIRSLPFGVGPLACVAAIPGAVVLWRRSRDQAIVLFSFAAASYLILGSGYTVFFRYILPLVPIVCVMAAAGSLAAAEWLARSAKWRLSSALACVLLAVAGPGLVNAVWFDLVLARQDTRVISARFLETRLQPEHTLYDAGGAYARLDLERLRFHQWYEFDRYTRSFGDPTGAIPDWLVLYESPLRGYVRYPAELRALAESRYTLVLTVPGSREGAWGAVYDQQDAFFMPVWGAWTVERPGPTVQIYERQR